VSPKRRPTADESRLLALARDLAGLTTTMPPARLLEAALTRLAPPTALAPPKPSVKARELAAAFAHEQARLAMQDILDREASRGTLRQDLPLPLLAWLLVTARDGLAHETSDALEDRLQALGRFIRLTPGRAGS